MCEPAAHLTLEMYLTVLQIIAIAGYLERIAKRSEIFKLMRLKCLLNDNLPLRRSVVVSAGVRGANLSLDIWSKMNDKKNNFR